VHSKVPKMPDTMLDALPRELVMAVVDQMDRKSLLSFRLTSMQACKLSEMSFARRFMENITIEGSKDGVAQLIDMLDLPHAQLKAESLTIKSPELSRGLFDSLRDDSGTAAIPTAVLADILRKLPNLKTLRLMQTWEMSGLLVVDLTRSVLEALVKPGVPSLNALELKEAVLGGGLLMAALRSHRKSLTKLSLRRIEIEGGLPWYKIFGLLRDEMSLQDLVLVDLCDHTLDNEFVFLAGPQAVIAAYGEGTRDGPDRCWFFGNGAYMSGAGVEGGFRRLSKLSEIQP